MRHGTAVAGAPHLRPLPRCHALRRPAALAASAGAPPPDELLLPYRKLQNGSDVRGVALPGVEGQPMTLTPERTAFIAHAFAKWLAEKLGRPVSELRVSVGSDPRLSGPALADALVAGLASAGATPVRLGLATTPACFMSCITAGYAFDASIMLTASHLPWNRNGMKFFTQSGGLGKKDISALVDGAAAAAAASAAAPSWWVAPPAVESVDFLPVYAGILVEKIRAGVAHPTHYATPLAGMRVVVDAGNGAGGFFAAQVLAPLGAETAGSQFLDPDGSFPNHVPNPEDAAAVDSAAAAVRAAGADLGVVFDTDVDRSAIIDRSGAAINRNRLIALLAAITLRERPGATIVTDSVTSDGLSAFIAAKGGVHCRFKRGYKNVIDKGLELTAAGADVPLMIETSGHGAMAENFYLDDGAYLAVKVLVEAGRRALAGQGGVEQMLGELREPAAEAEFRLPLTGSDFKAAGAAVVEALAAAVTAEQVDGWARAAGESHEGFRASVAEGAGLAGWALLRQSLHDPLLVLNVESDLPDGAARIAHTALCWLEQQGGSAALSGGVDLAALRAPFEAGGVWADFDGNSVICPASGSSGCEDPEGDCAVKR